MTQMKLGEGLWGGYAWKCPACQQWQFEDPGAVAGIRSTSTGETVAGAGMTSQPEGRVACRRVTAAGECDFNQHTLEADFIQAAKWDCECGVVNVIIAELIEFTPQQVAEEVQNAYAVGETTTIKIGDSYEQFPEQSECSCGEVRRLDI